MRLLLRHQMIKAAGPQPNQRVSQGSLDALAAVRACFLSSAGVSIYCTNCSVMYLTRSLPLAMSATSRNVLLSKAFPILFVRNHA